MPLFDNPRHPNVVADTQMTLQRLTSIEPPDLLLHNHPQRLGRPLDPALPVNPSCHTCLDSAAWSDMLKTLATHFADNLQEAQAQRAK